MKLPSLYRLVDLGRQFNLPLSEVVQWSQKEIEIQFAYNLLQDAEYRERLIKELEIEKQRAMTPDERWKYLKQKRSGQ